MLLNLVVVVVLREHLRNLRVFSAQCLHDHVRALVNSRPSPSRRRSLALPQAKAVSLSLRRGNPLVGNQTRVLVVPAAARDGLRLDLALLLRGQLRLGLGRDGALVLVGSEQRVRLGGGGGGLGRVSLVQVWVRTSRRTTSRQVLGVGVDRLLALLLVDHIAAGHVILGTDGLADEGGD